MIDWMKTQLATARKAVGEQEARLVAVRTEVTVLEAVLAKMEAESGGQRQSGADQLAPTVPEQADPEAGGAGAERTTSDTDAD